VLSRFVQVGKSSLINSLTRARRAAVGNMPGLTRSLQTVKLDHQISLIDSPGVMFSAGRKDDGSDDANMVLRNCLRFEQLADPVGAAWQVVARCTVEQLQEAYGLEGQGFEDAEQFLFLVAQKRGKLLKGGVPDVEGAAKIVLKDWNDGRISYCSEPPVDAAASDLRVGGAEVLSKWSAEFDVEALLNAPVVEVDEADMERVAAQERAAQELLANPLGSRTLHDEHEAAAAAASAAAAAAAAEPRPIVPRPKASTGGAAAMDAGEEEELDMDDPAAVSAAAAAVPVRKVAAHNSNNPQHNQQVKRSLAEQRRRERKAFNRSNAAASAAASAAVSEAEEEEDMDGGEEQDYGEDHYAQPAAAAAARSYDRDLADME
jgi:nuclear GTP-binding protein